MDQKKIEECRKALNLDKNDTSDEEVWEIIEVTKQLVRIYIRSFKNKKVAGKH